MSVIDWGDIPTWVGAVFAAGAAGAAVWTLASQRAQIREQRQFIAEQTSFMAEQRQNLELERAELRAAAEERREAQARQVRMYQRMLGGQDDGLGGLTGGPDHWAVTVQNPSDAPIHQLEVRFGTAYMASDAWEWPAFEPSRRGATVGDRLAMPVYLLGPGRAVRFASQSWPAATVHNNRPVLFFTDDNGLRWQLDSYGKLEEAPAEPGA
ncbi:hypothetical protein JL475_24350 [Streptomyces sp. M2CJ-2]|uniref:hypothetical protein n=1 Tax=Streptomyces sp. M2CJ-2 TaxID=2803948 RepID=UPI0019295F01|nr:hypothetical protein [Streptomyces sp. M2CJ-2]MBL3669067.1 hypothetical protein [Streptomyces sp. M2CJ-2]